MSPYQLRAPLIAALAATIVSHPALGDDASRVTILESQIQQLRTRIDEQNRRLDRLEAELSRRTGEPRIVMVPEGRANPAVKSATGKQPWHAPEAWDRVAKGMTQAQVIEILGPPSSVESMAPYSTLFYRLDSLDGLVNLREDRVVAVRKPEFGK